MDDTTQPRASTSRSRPVRDMTVRLIFGAFLIGATLLALRMNPDVLARLSVRSWLGLFAGSRVLGVAVVYLVFGDLAQYSDLVLYYTPEARQALDGQLPYRDFATSYGFLFPYLSGVLLPVWNTRAAVALVMIACEIVAVWVFVSTVSRAGVAQDIGLRRALAVYLVNPAAVYWSGMLGYNSAVVLLFWVLAFSALLVGRYGRSLQGLVGSVVVGKFLGLLAVPVWLADPRRTISALVGTGAFGVVLLAGAAAFDVNLLMPLLREGGRSTSANVWFLTSALVPFDDQGWLWRVGPLALFGVGALAVAGRFAVCWTRPPNAEQLSAAIGAVGWLFMLVSKKSYPHYVPMFLLFTVFALCQRGPASRRAAIVLAALGAIGVVEPGLWNALGQPQQLVPALDDRTASLWVQLIVADVAMIAGGLYIGVECLRRAMSAPEAA